MNKKIIIWSLVVGFFLNFVFIQITIEDACDFYSNNLICYRSFGWPIQTKIPDTISGRDIAFSEYLINPYGLFNLFSWFFIVWALFNLLKKTIGSRIYSLSMVITLSKKVIILVLVAGFIVNSLVSYITQEPFSYGCEPVKLEGNPGFRNNPGYGGCLTGYHVGWPFRYQVNYYNEYDWFDELKYIIDDNWYALNGHYGLKDSIFEFWLNFLFWSFVVWIILNIFIKIKNKYQEASITR